jgi:hypothetical protein
MKTLYVPFIALAMAALVACAIVTHARADEHGYTGDGTFKDE